jgi:hypothetical protein
MDQWIDQWMDVKETEQFGQSRSNKLTAFLPLTYVYSYSRDASDLLADVVKFGVGAPAYGRRGLSSRHGWSYDAATRTDNWASTAEVKTA